MTIANSKSHTVLKSKVIVLFLFVIINFSCTTKSSQSDFQESFIDQIDDEDLNQKKLKEVAEESYEKNKESFKVVQSSNDLIIELKNIPVKLLALKELKNKPDFSKQQLDSVIRTYGDLKYFNLQFTSNKRNLYADIKKSYDSNFLTKTLNSRIASRFKLDSLYTPTVFHYNSTMGVFPGFSFFIGYEKEVFNQAEKLTIEKSIFNEIKIELDITSLAKPKS